MPEDQRTKEKEKEKEKNKLYMREREEGGNDGERCQTGSSHEVMKYIPTGRSACHGQYQQL